MKLVKMLLAGGLFALMSKGAIAHHSWASLFDVNGDSEIEGEVSRIVWRNPHIQLEITTDDGVAYEIESNSVASLTRMGVSKELLAEGTRVRIAGYPIRDGSAGIFMNHLLLPDQTEIIFLRNAEPRWDGKTIGTSDRLQGKVVEEDFDKRPTSIFAVWTTIYGAEGSHRALNDEVQWTEHALAYQAAQEAAGLVVERDRHDCSPYGFLTAMGAPYPIELVDQGDTVLIKAEYYDTYRTVHMNPPEQAPEIPKDGLGYATGHWLGDSLVVETLLHREAGVEGDEQMSVQETFTLSGDHNRLLYTRVVIDPLMRAMPTVDKKWWQYQPGAFVQPYNCSSGE